MSTYIKGEYIEITSPISQESFLALTWKYWREIGGHRPAFELNSNSDFKSLAYTGGLLELKEGFKIEGMHNVEFGNLEFREYCQETGKILRAWASIRPLITLRDKEVNPIKRFEVSMGQAHNEFFTRTQPFGYLVNLVPYKGVGYSIAIELKCGRVRIMKWNEIKACTGLTDKINFYSVFLPL